MIVMVSALFAISQYYETRQRNTIEKEQDEVKGFSVFCDESHVAESYPEGKKTWDDFLREKPLNNHKIIIILLMLIMGYVCLFVLSLFSSFIKLWFPEVSNIYDILIIIYGLLITLPAMLLLILAPWLLYNIRQMKKQLERMQVARDKLEALDEFCKALSNKTSSCAAPSCSNPSFPNTQDSS